MAVSASVRTPSNRSRSTARNASISVSREDTTWSPASNGTTDSPGSANRTRSTALASRYFIGILADRAERRLDIYVPLDGEDSQSAPVLSPGPEPGPHAPGGHARRAAPRERAPTRQSGRPDLRIADARRPARGPRLVAATARAKPHQPFSCLVRPKCGSCTNYVPVCCATCAAFRFTWLGLGQGFPLSPAPGFDWRGRFV